MRNGRYEWKAGLLLVAVAQILSPNGVLAAGNGLKVAFFDYQQVITQTEFGKAAKARLEALKEQGERQVASEQGQLQHLQTELTEAGSALDPKAKKEKHEILSKKTAELEAHVASLRRELGTVQSQLLEEINQELLRVVTECAKEKKYDLVLERRQAGIYFANDALDVTKTIIERLDTRTRAKPGVTSSEKKK